MNYAISNTEFTFAESSIRLIFGFTFRRILKSGMHSISLSSSFHNYRKVLLQMVHPATALPDGSYDIRHRVPFLL